MHIVSDYKVVSADDHKMLTTKVCDNIEDGWVPVGGVAFNTNTSKAYQALIRYQPNDWHPAIAGPD